MKKLIQISLLFWAIVLLSAQIGLSQVIIPDTNFRIALNEHLGYVYPETETHDPTIAELNGITGSFDSRYTNIYSIEGAQYLTGITSLFLQHNNISDISALTGLTNLTELGLGTNQISDLNPLSGLTNIIYFSVDDNQVIDISPLSGLNCLTFGLRGNQISDLTPLAGLSNLPYIAYIGLANNQITDINPLSGLNNLSALDLNDNQINDISAISGLSNLTEFYIAYNQISDLSALSALSNLTTLILNGNNFNDIYAISGLTNLSYIDLTGCNISDVTALSGLTNIITLKLEGNTITDIFPLLENNGLGFEDNLSFEGYGWSNPLSQEAINIHIPILQSKGFNELLVPEDPNNYAACYPIPGRNETGVASNIQLEWQGNFESTNAVFEVWLSESADSLINLGDGTAINDTLYAFSPSLSPNTDYFWKIRTITPSDTLWSGLWQFNTGENGGVNVPDTNFRIALNEQLGYVYPETETHDPTIAELNSITGYFDARYTNIYSIEGAQHLNNITSLDLSGNQIVDISAVTGLTNLYGIYLNENQISDINPIAGLTNLGDLELPYNQISDISAVTGLTNLDSLDFRGNQINDISAVSGLTNLIHLSLNENQINDISAVSGLTNLWFLDLSFNQISDISAVTGLTNLYEIYLNENQISDINPIAGLTNLGDLDLESNQISDINPIAGLTNLTRINLTFNQISDLSPIVGLTNLISLFLYDNQITDIYPLTENTGLGSGDYLEMDNYGLTIPLSHEAFEVHLPILQNRGFNILRFPNVPNDVAACYPIPERNETGVASDIQLEWQGNFESTDAVFEVWLSESADSLINLGNGIPINDNSYTFTPDLCPNIDYFWKIRTITPNDTLWSGLWQFNTGENGGVNVPDTNFRIALNEHLGYVYPETVNHDPTIVELNGITGYFDARNTNIYSIEGAQYLNNITNLYLSGNQIVDISAVSGLMNLSELYLIQNQINDISAVSGLTNLYALALDFNQISDISVVSGLTNLGTLHLSGNQISDISAVSGLTNLQSLGLNENQISDINPLSGLTNLTRLNVSYTQISDLNPLLGLTNLDELILISNEISDLNVLSGLTNLTMLYLGMNQISDLNPLSGLTNLTRLGLGSNQISDLNSLSELTNLDWLDLGYNQISDINPLLGLTNLTDIYLIGNQITDLTPIAGLTNLLWLHLSDNQITDIYPLIENTGLGLGDHLYIDDGVRTNPLSHEAMEVHLPILQSRGFNILRLPNTANNVAACYPIPERNEIGVALDIQLEWQGNFESTNAVFEVWLSESADSLINLGNGTAINDTLYSFTPSLSQNTDYFWKIRTITPNDTLWSGLWQFNTDLLANIPDTNFRIAINEHLGYTFPETETHYPTIIELNGISGSFDAEESDIYSIEGAQYLNNITNLYLSENQISDISPLSDLSNLEILIIHWNQVSDLSPLSGLTNLYKLEVGRNQISDLNPIAGLTNLIFFNANENQISDISPLSGLTNLNRLSLEYNQISDLNPISGLTNLLVLYLINNQISDLNPLSGLTNLEYFGVSHNQISDLTPLSGLTNLYSLEVGCNQISDLNPISGLTNLEYFSVFYSYSQISDLTPLSGLTNLRSINVSGNQISDLTPIVGLTNLRSLELFDNQITDIYPLTENTGLGSGDYLYIDYYGGSTNPISHEALEVHLPILQSRGFNKLWLPEDPNNYAACYPIPERNETEVPLDIQLEWQGNFESPVAVFDVWLGESADSLINLGNGTAINDTLYAFSPSLSLNTDYFWKIRTITPNDTLWSGLWQFNTNEPPNISVNPNFLSELLLLDSTSSQILTITNDGGGELNWTINMEETTEVINQNIIIWDPDPTPTGVALKTEIEAINSGNTYYSTDLSTYPLNEDVDILFILLGIYNNNYVLTQMDADIITPYLDSGGCVYMEGGDTWYWDAQTSLHSYFNIDPISDGSRDLVNVTGLDFLDGMNFQYNGENQWIDRIEPLNGSVCILRNDSPDYGCGIAYNSGTYKTIGTSLEIYHLNNGSSSELLVEILNYFKTESNWLSADILSGTISPYSTQGINITFDANDLSIGDYTANININSNDPDEPLVTVPVELSVIDCNPATVECPQNITVGNDTGECGAIVTFNANVGGNPEPVITYSPASGSFFPVGTTEVSVTAENNCGIDSCNFFVTVEDTILPVLISNSTPIILWPPNHKYETIDLNQIVISISDNCADLSTSDVYITSVSSDEAENAPGGGDGNTIDDIVISSSCNSVDLRKECSGNGNGRVYTIYLAVDDGNGNTGTASCQVHVPHNNGSPAIDDGMVYEEICGSKSSFVVSQAYDAELKNYPNPFSGSTTIEFSLTKANYTKLVVYNFQGIKVATLFDDDAKADQVYKFQFDALNLTPGIYFCNMQSGKNVNIMKKMILN